MLADIAFSQLLLQTSDNMCINAISSYLKPDLIQVSKSFAKSTDSLHVLAVNIPL